MEKTTRKGKNKKNRFCDYKDWLNEPQDKDDLKDRLEKAGVPLELRTMTALEGQGYRCSSFHCKDLATGKYRELDIYAWKTYGKSFSVCDCEVAFDILVLAECKYSYSKDFLAFERLDKRLPAFPVIFEGRRLFGAPYQDFEFPIIIRKIAETDVKNLDSAENFDDKKTHEACEKLTSCFSQIYERNIASFKPHLSQFQNQFEPSWKKFMDNISQPINNEWNFNQAVGEFLKSFTEHELLREVHYFPIKIGFPILVIPQERGLIRIKHDIASGQISDFEDVGYGIYPYVSENADSYNNILSNYFEFPIIISNLGYLEKCLDALYKGLDKMVTYANTLLKNSPKALATEIMKRLYFEKTIGQPKK